MAGSGAAFIRGKTGVFFDEANAASPTAPKENEFAAMVDLNGDSDIGQAVTAITGGENSISTVSVQRLRTLADEKGPGGTETSDIVVTLVQDKTAANNTIEQNLAVGDTGYFYLIPTDDIDAPNTGDVGWHWKVVVADIGPGPLDLSGAHTIVVTFTCAPAARCTVAANA